MLAVIKFHTLNTRACFWLGLHFSMMSTGEAKKKKRTSKNQQAIYLKALVEHSVLITGKLTPLMDPADLEILWDQVTEDLNSCGDGPLRTAGEWRKVSIPIFPSCKWTVFVLLDGI